MGPAARRRPEIKADTERVLDLFPILRERLDEPAGNLSGGQQQMLTLGMAFIGKPRLLMIDELSLGPGPVGGGPAARDGAGAAAGARP